MSLNCVRLGAYRCVFTHTTVSIWNIGNNSPIYFNTLDQLWWRLGLSGKRLSELHTTLGEAGFWSTMAGLAVFTCVNQKAYAAELVKALWPQTLEDSPQEPQEDAESYAWFLPNLVSALIKTLANTGSIAVFFMRETNIYGCLAASTLAFLANILGNTAFYGSKAGHQSLSCIAHSALRVIAAAIYAASSAFLYFESFNGFLEHIGLQDDVSTSHWNDPDNLVINSFNIIGNLAVFLATFNKYNNYLGQAMGQLEFTLPDILNSPFITCSAALTKGAIAASSAFAALFAQEAGLTSSSIVTGIGFFASVLVQGAQLKPTATPPSSEQEAPLVNNDELRQVEEGRVVPEEQPRQQTHRRGQSWCCWFRSVLGCQPSIPEEESLPLPQLS